MDTIVYLSASTVFCCVVCVIGLYIMCDIIAYIYTSEKLHLSLKSYTQVKLSLFTLSLLTNSHLLNVCLFVFYLCANVFCLVQPLLFKECDTATICTPLLSSNTWLLWQKHKHRRAFPVDGLAASKKGLNVTSKFPSSVSSSSHHQPRPNVIILLYNSISFFPLLLHCRQIV